MSCHDGVVPALLKPFIGYIPTSEFGHRVVGPPASTLSATQIEAARKDPLSFRYALGRSANRSHPAANEWLHECLDQGVLNPVGPAVFVYRQGTDNSAVTGIVADVSLAAYDAGLVRRHEKTITKTQRKMVDYMQTTRVYGNPVALTHRTHEGVEATIAALTVAEPDTAFSTADGLSHELWVVGGPAAEDLCGQVNGVLYITDGHHRIAAASVVAAREGRADSGLPAGLFAADKLQLRSFARCVVDPDLDADAVVRRLRSSSSTLEVGEIEARPQQRNEFGIRVRDRFFKVHIDSRAVPEDPYESLDVNLLQNMILGPIFGITDPDQDKRLRFTADLAAPGQPNTDSDAWLLPFPSNIEDVMDVADSGRVMPPKSTLFAPKLPSGLVIRKLEQS